MRNHVTGGQNNADYMFTTHDDHDEFGVASPGPCSATSIVCAHASAGVIFVSLKDNSGNIIVVSLT